MKRIAKAAHMLRPAARHAVPRLSGEIMASVCETMIDVSPLRSSTSVWKLSRNGYEAKDIDSTLGCVRILGCIAVGTRCGWGRERGVLTIGLPGWVLAG